MTHKSTLGDQLFFATQSGNRDIQHPRSNLQTQRPKNIKTADARDNEGNEIASILGADDQLPPQRTKESEVPPVPAHIAQLLAAKKLLQEKRAQQNAQLAQIRTIKPVFTSGDREKGADQRTGKARVADRLIGWVPAQGTLADGRQTPNFAAFDLPDGSHISPLQQIPREKAAFSPIPAQNPAQMVPQSPAQVPTAATGAQPMAQAQAQMQGFMQKKPQMAGNIGLPGTGLDGPIDTRATAMPGTPGHAATNVIDQRGGLDPRGLTVDGNNAAGEAKAGFKMAESIHDYATRICRALELDLMKILDQTPDREKKAQVGGVVVEVVPDGNRYWVNTDDHGDECAIFVEKNANSDKIKPGDSVWWQGRDAMWTTKAVREGAEGDSDIKIPRIGYSGVSRPGEKTAFDLMGAIAPGMSRNLLPTMKAVGNVGANYAKNQMQKAVNDNFPGLKAQSQMLGTVTNLMDRHYPQQALPERQQGQDPISWAMQNRQQLGNNAVRGVMNTTATVGSALTGAQPMLKNSPQSGRPANSLPASSSPSTVAPMTPSAGATSLTKAGSLGDQLLKAASYLKTVGWVAATESQPKRRKRDAAQDDAAMEAIGKKRQRAATDLLKSLNRGNRRVRVVR